MGQVKFKLWEKALLLFAAALCILSCVVFITDSKLIVKYFFGFTESEGGVLIGKVAKMSGSLRRQISGEAEFKSISENSPVHNMDMVVTGADSEAKIEFNDGGAAVLGPNTMVRLSFAADTDFGNISRVQGLQVVSGTVTGSAGKRKLQIINQNKVYTISSNSTETMEVSFSPASAKPVIKTTAKLTSQEVSKPQPVSTPTVPAPELFMVTAPAKPSPSPLAIVTPSPVPSSLPSPTPMASPLPVFTLEQASKVKILAPKLGETFSIPPYSKKAERTIQLSWKRFPVEEKTKVVVWKLKDGQPQTEDSRTEVFSKIVPSKKGIGTADFVVQAPGQYAWEISGVNGDPISNPENSKSTFIVNPEFEGIKPTTPLVGGKSSTSNKLDGDLLTKFDITLRWETYSNVVGYKLWLVSSPTSKKPFFEKSTPQPEYTLNKNKIFVGQFYYKIFAQLSSGFIVTSKPQKFIFSFLPPVQVVPENSSVITKRSLRRDDHRLLLTWQKTNFTSAYELEISNDPGFNTIVIKKTLKENFFILSHPKDGRYWWRVRGFSSELTSPMSSPFQFTILNDEVPVAAPPKKN